MAPNATAEQPPTCSCCGGPRSVYSVKWCASCYHLKTRPPNFENTGATGFRLVHYKWTWMAIGPDELYNPKFAYRGVGRTPEEAVKLLLSFGRRKLRAAWKRAEPDMPTLEDFVREEGVAR